MDAGWRHGQCSQGHLNPQKAFPSPANWLIQTVPCSAPETEQLNVPDSQGTVLGSSYPVQKVPSHLKSSGTAPNFKKAFEQRIIPMGTSWELK